MLQLGSIFMTALFEHLRPLGNVIGAVPSRAAPASTHPFAPG
jgi:hypothetical protein